LSFNTVVPVNFIVRPVLAGSDPRIPNATPEWRAANIEVKFERIARDSDELENRGQVSAKPAVVRGNPAAREESQRSVSRGGQFMVETADRNGFEI
jgi:hypothetical protein